MIDWLLGTLLATSLLTILVLALREPLRRFYGPSAAYALWLLPAARAVFPSFTRTVERVVAPAMPDIPGQRSIIIAGAAPPEPVESLVHWPQLLVALWLAGAAAMLLRGLILYRAQRRLILANAVRMAGIGDIRILRSSIVAGPMAFGLLDRVIVVPLDFDHKFTERQRRLALAHELAHHRSGDLLANLIAFVLLCLQWFNPLAWAAHAAFRFDQEAACDARVLDKADARDRASYGEAIAKAATHRSLLFAGALDQPSTLSRRLKIMTNSNRFKSRRAGLLLVGGGVLLALPLTASSAVRYVDIAAPAPIVTSPSVVAATPVVAPIEVVAPVPVVPSIPTPAVEPVKLAALAPAAVAAPRKNHTIMNDGDLSISEDSVWINGQRKRWEDLSPGELARVRAATVQARKSISEQITKLPEQMATLERTREMFRSGDFQRQMADARKSMESALAQIDAQSAMLRAAGQDPEKVKREMRKSLEEMRRTDPAKIARESMLSVDPAKLSSEILNASKSIDEIEAKLNRLERR